MKIKFLLFVSCAIVITGNVKAQSSKIDARAAIAQQLRLDQSEQDDQLKPAPPAKTTLAHRKSATNKVNSACAVTITSIGGAPNGLTVLQRGRSNINYNKDLNAVALIHRAPVTGPFLTTGYYAYDYNPTPTNDLGWVFNQGPIYADPTGLGNWYRGRYPACDFYNPPGNTDPANAFLVWQGPWTSYSTTQLWLGRLTGSCNMSKTVFNQHIDSVLTPAYDPNVFVTKTGDAWKIGFQLTPTSFYNNKLMLSKGHFDASSKDFIYTNVDFACPADSNLGITDEDIAFADDGMTGYIVALTNNDGPITYTCTPDSIIYITIYKTTDGGSHWSKNIDLDIQHVLDAQLANDGSTYGAFVDMDPVVDANKNLHINTAIMPSSSYAVDTMRNKWGQYDIYTTDQGTTWQAQLLDKPKTFIGTWVGSGGNYAEYNRPFSARSDDGTKLFFGWFDTDPASFAGGNLYPNLVVKAYDLTSGMWTAATDLTSGTDADGFCTFGNGAYYVIENSGVYTIPVFVQQIVSTIDNGTQMFYVNGACVSASDFTLAGSPVTIPLLTCAPVQNPQVFPFSGINELTSSNQLSVSGNYPNPFTGTTTIAVTLPKPGDVTVEVSNMVGQILSTKTYRNLIAGNNNLTIDCTDYASGLYVYKVKSGLDLVTNTMIVK